MRVRDLNVISKHTQTPSIPFVEEIPWDRHLESKKINSLGNSQTHKRQIVIRITQDMSN